MYFDISPSKYTCTERGRVNPVTAGTTEHPPLSEQKPADGTSAPESRSPDPAAGYTRFSAIALKCKHAHAHTHAHTRQWFQKHRG